MLETQWVCFRKPISQVLYFFEAMTSSSWNGGTWPSGAFVSHFEQETARGWFVQWEEVGQTQQKIKEGTLSKASMEAHEFRVPRPKRYSSAEDAEYPCILKQVRLDLANLVVFFDSLRSHDLSCKRVPRDSDTQWQAYGEFGKDGYNADMVSSLIHLNGHPST